MNYGDKRLNKEEFNPIYSHNRTSHRIANSTISPQKLPILDTCIGMIILTEVVQS